MQKVLVIQQKMIGDVLVSSMLCDHLKDHFPEAELHYLVNAHTIDVVRHHPSIDKIVVFHKEYRDSKTQFLKFLKEIRRERYNTVIDVYGKLESGLITFFSGAAVKITYKKWYSRAIYTHQLPLRPRTEGKTGITVEDRLGLLAPLISAPLKRTIQPKIFLTQDEIATSSQFLRERGIDPQNPILMLNILGSSAMKTYPLDYMAAVIDFISENFPATLLFNYIPSQSKEAEELYERCNERSKINIKFHVFAPSLRGFLGLLFHCNALIGNEGGAVNMAKALSVPTFSIYSPRIDKMAWHTFADQWNQAVHLSDFFPDLLKNRAKKELTAMTPEFYKQLKPELFFDLLGEFLGTQVFPDQ